MLRMLGWRYSFPREAWVHRIGQGRLGPVFVERRPGSTSGGATAIPVRVGPEALPRIEARPIPMPRGAPRPEASPRRKVRVQLDPDAPPVEVLVDGAPPLVGGAKPTGPDRETA